MKPETVLIMDDDRAADSRMGLHRALEVDCALVTLDITNRAEELLDRARIERRASGAPPAGSLKA